MTRATSGLTDTRLAAHASGPSCPRHTCASEESLQPWFWTTYTPSQLQPAARPAILRPATTPPRPPLDPFYPNAPHALHRDSAPKSRPDRAGPTTGAPG